MNTRGAKRIIAGYKVEIIYFEKCYIGLIENLSETGVNLLTDFAENPPDFLPGESVSLKIDTPAGEPLLLTCIIKWSHKVQPHNMRSRIGLVIIDPPWDNSSYFI